MTNDTLYTLVKAKLILSLGIYEEIPFFSLIKLQHCSFSSSVLLFISLFGRRDRLSNKTVLKDEMGWVYCTIMGL